MVSEKKVVLGFSGGVDSLAAAVLLRRRGYGVVPVFLEMGGAGSVFLRQRAAGAAEKSGLELVVEDVSTLFYRQVVDYLKTSYLAARTPNPCIRCNAFVKFAGLAAVADRLGIEHIATGHYFRSGGGEVSGDTGLICRRAVDRTKDQSYFLSQVPAKILGRALFPLGELSKNKVCEIAFAAGYELENYRESQELCFLNGENYRDFLRCEGLVGTGSGDIVTRTGECIGRHRGLQNYTVGQRRGLDIAWSEPLYVLELDFAGNRLVVGPRAVAGRRELLARELNWLVPPPVSGAEISCQIRHRHTAALARIFPVSGAEIFRVVFIEPQFAVAPGQGVAFYDGDRLLGGGVISLPPGGEKAGKGS